MSIFLNIIGLNQVFKKLQQYRSHFIFSLTESRIRGQQINVDSFIDEIYRIHLVDSGAINMNAGAIYQHLNFMLAFLFIE